MLILYDIAESYVTIGHASQSTAHYIHCRHIDIAVRSYNKKKRVTTLNKNPRNTCVEMNGIPYYSMTDIDPLHFRLL